MRGTGKMHGLSASDKAELAYLRRLTNDLHDAILALRTIAGMPFAGQDDVTAYNMRRVAREVLSRLER